MLQPGTQVGRYEIQRRLGRGGMGTVYVAHDPVLGRMVAIKVFLSDLEMADASERFAREARSAAALNHANIVTIHDFGDVALQPYIVMEYVQGETLAEIIKRKAPVPLSEKLRWIEDLCSGVAYAHQFSVIHRDIKPTNLMLDRSGRLKILDFGIAKMLGTLATNATALIGTPGYMAPEQILGGGIDARSDLFSIGVVLYELLAYTEAFPGDTIPAITHRIVSEEPVALTRLVPDVPPDLVAIVERALKKSAADRYSDAEMFRAAIGRVRRQLESETGFDQTLIQPRPAAGPGFATNNRIGTGSARKQMNDAVSVAELTPPPDPRKTDKEALQRRRAAQIAAALELARHRLAEGELEHALEACHQALTLDDNCADALDLEQEVQAAIGRRRAGELFSDARDELENGALTTALDLLQRARALDPDAADGKRLERDLRLARAEQERLRQRHDAISKLLDSAVQALDRGDIEGAVAYSRQALELDPDSADAQSLEAEAMRRLDEAVALPTVDFAAAGVAAPDKTIIAPSKRHSTPPPTGRARTGAAAKTTVAPPKTGPAAKPAVAKPAAKTGAPKAAPRKDPLVALRGSMASAGSSVSSAFDAAKTRLVAMPKRQKQILAAVAAVVVLAAAAGAAIVLMPARVIPTGTLVVEAVPWASIASIQSADGTSQPLPNPASTPIALTLPAGTYTIRLAGLGLESETRELTVEVTADATASLPVQRFIAITPEEYFEKYLAPATESPAAAPAEPAPDAVPPPPDAAQPAAPPPNPKPPGALQ